MARMVGLPIQSLGLRQIPVASKMVVGVSTIRILRVGLLESMEHLLASLCSLVFLLVSPSAIHGLLVKERIKNGLAWKR